MGKAQLPALQIAEKLHILNLVDEDQKDSLKQEILNILTSHVLVLDQDLLLRMKSNNIAKILELNQMLKLSLQDRSGIETYIAYFTKFAYLMEIFNPGYIKVHIQETYKYKHMSGLLRNIVVWGVVDYLFWSLQFCFFYKYLDKIPKFLTRATKYLDKEDIWNSSEAESLKARYRYRLKVFEGLYFMCICNFEKAAQLFLETISNFICHELISYKTFILYTVLSSTVSSHLASLKQKVVESPKIRQAIEEIEYLSEFMNSLYECSYKSLFENFDALNYLLSRDRYLAPHKWIYINLVRRVAYIQYINPYEIVHMEIMASVFGVSQDIINEEVVGLFGPVITNYHVDIVEGKLALVRDKIIE